MRLSTCRINCAMVSHSALASGTGADGDNDNDEEDTETEAGEEEEEVLAAEVRAPFTPASGALLDDATATSV